MSGVYSNSPCTEEGCKNFPLHLRNFFSEFTFSLDKNSNGGYEGPSIL
jgi:hypothetical protein